MLVKREYLYYSLLKRSDHGTLDQAVDRLSSLPSVELSNVCPRVLLDCLLKLSQDEGVYSVPEIAQLCMDVRFVVEKDGSRAVTAVLLGRALEAAGVAAAIINFTARYKTYMESRLYRTKGLQHLLNSHGDQVLRDMSDDISRFEARFVERALQMRATLQGLLALKKTHLEVYKIFTKRRKVKQCRTFRGLRRFKTLSLCLDDAELDEDETPKVVKLLPGRRAFSVDVQAGLDLPVPETLG